MILGRSRDLGANCGSNEAHPCLSAEDQDNQFLFDDAPFFGATELRLNSRGSLFVLRVSISAFIILLTSQFQSTGLATKTRLTRWPALDTSSFAFDLTHYKQLRTILDARFAAQVNKILRPEFEPFWIAKESKQTIESRTPSSIPIVGEATLRNHVGAPAIPPPEPQQ